MKKPLASAWFILWFILGMAWTYFMRNHPYVGVAVILGLTFAQPLYYGFLTYRDAKRELRKA